MECPYCKLEIFLPESHLEAVRTALIEADAGHVGNYDSCMSYYEVSGCWRPLPGSAPYAGEENVLCQASELKVEVLVARERVKETIAAVKRAHPYETPVIYALALYDTGL